MCAAAEDGAREHNDRGLFAYRDRRFADAAREFETVRALDPAFPDADLNLGLALFQAREYQSAIDALRRARAAHPDSPELLFALGTSLARTRQNTEAHRVFEEFLRVQPDTAQWHLFWGDAYASQNQVDKAAQEFRRAIELDPKIASAHFGLGILALGTLDDKPNERPLRHGDKVTVKQLLAVIWSKDLGEKKSELVDALSQLRLDIKYLMFDLEVTRRERDALRDQLADD